VRTSGRLLLVLLLLLMPSAPLLGSASSPQAKQQTSAQEPVDINAASLDQLMKVPGMTRTWAARIIRFRPYRGKNELLDRGVVSGEVYARIKDHIVAHRAQKQP
jgi:competence protein ComEA